MSNPPVAAGQEILVVDADDQVVKGLDRLLTRVGMIVTGTHDPIRARDQLLNKFYAVDLSPEKSLVKYVMSQGLQMFVVSWRNPTAEQRDWDMSTYVQALDARSMADRVLRERVARR